MTAVAWPASLPKFRLDGYAETVGENVLREEMDVGPNKTRRRATVVPVSVTGTVVMTKSQFATWQNFYTNVLFHGTVAFAMKSLDGTLRDMYVTEPPNYAPWNQLVVVTLTCEYVP